MLILAFMLKLNREWEKAHINIWAVVNTSEEQRLLYQGIEDSLSEARIPAKVHIILKNDERFPVILRRESTGADIVSLGLKVTREEEEENHTSKIEEMSSVAKTVVFVQNNSVREAMPILLHAR